MKSKLHVGILIVLITFFVKFLDNPVAPNQQILIQFSDSDISEVEAKKTVETIQTKLHVIGVDRIQVEQDEKGQLKITYYSTTAVEDIQSILAYSENFRLTYGYADDNSDGTSDEKNSDHFKLDVSEIRDGNYSKNLDFDGVQIVEHNQKFDRFNHLKKHTSGHQINSRLISEKITVAINSLHENLSVDNYSYQSPEVRAGPLS